MASVRQRADTWQVLYRHGGKQASKTFDSESAAVRVRDLIDALGPDRALAALADELTHHGPTLHELAQQWFDFKKRDLTPRALADYKRDYHLWIEEHTVITKAERYLARGDAA